MKALPIEPTPDMIAAGADALEYVNGIGRWLAEALAQQVLERALAAHHQRTPASDGYGSGGWTIVYCGGPTISQGGHHSGFGPRHF